MEVVAGTESGMAVAMSVCGLDLVTGRAALTVTGDVLNEDLKCFCRV